MKSILIKKLSSSSFSEVDWTDCVLNGFDTRAAEGDTDGTQNPHF